MKEQKEKDRKLLGTTMVILLFIFMLFALSMVNNVIPYIDTIKLENHWDLDINGEVQKDIHLEEIQFKAVGMGDRVTITTTVPKNDYIEPVARFWICHSKIEVFVDNECIYQFGVEAYNNNELVGSGYHWVTLPKDSEGKQLKIVFSPRIKDSFTSINALILSDAKNCYKDFISETFLIICVGVFLVVFGLVITIVTGFLSFSSRNYLAFFYIGLFAVCIGTWALCNKSDIQLISNNFTLNAYLEYFAIYFGSIPLLLFLREIRKEDDKKYKLGTVLVLVNIVLLEITLILHFTKVMQFPSMLIVFHVFCGVVVIYIIVTCIENIRKGHTEEELLLIGMGMFAVAFSLDLIIFNIAKYINGSIAKYMKFSALFALGFIVCMIISYAKYAYRGIYTKFEQRMLLKLAYEDNLTKLGNLAKYSQVISELEEEKKEFALILFDLNNLKVTNDTLGHSGGNLLLKSFASVLKASFGEKGQIARIGGDEFIVVLPGYSVKQVEVLLEKYQKNLALENQKDYPFEISAAYGVADTTEDQGITSKETYARVDMRMYKCKVNMKKQ